MREIVERLQENRQIELAKSILESKGYTVQNKIRESSEMSRKEIGEVYRSIVQKYGFRKSKWGGVTLYADNTDDIEEIIKDLSDAGFDVLDKYGDKRQYKISSGDYYFNLEDLDHDNSTLDLTPIKLSKRKVDGESQVYKWKDNRESYAGMGRLVSSDLNYGDISFHLENDYRDGGNRVLVTVTSSVGEIPGVTDTIFKSNAAAKRAVENYLSNSN